MYAASRGMPLLLKALRGRTVAFGETRDSGSEVLLVKEREENLVQPSISSKLAARISLVLYACEGQLKSAVLVGTSGRRQVLTDA